MRHALLLLFVLEGLIASAIGQGTREVYVWQRQFDEEVVSAIRAIEPQTDGVCVLAAEVIWKNGAMEVVRPILDFPALARLRVPVGVAVRIGDYPGAFASDDATARALRALAREAMAKARTGRLIVRELQVDFDCAESKLAGYRKWIEALRSVATEAGAKLILTALPAWLKHPDFAPLVRAADGFVLQVHSLERPKSPDEAFALCDPVRALGWAHQAGSAGVPFRVALPTYGYVLGFDPGGRFIGLAAEGPRPAWPVGTRQRIVRADAAAMAKLGASLLASPPPLCTGVIWFRLPVARDRYNWDTKTFEVVLRGEVPVARLTVELEKPEPGLVEVVVSNSGQTTEPLPARVQLRWPENARVLAADGIGGFRLEISNGAAQAIVHAAEVTADASVAPGRKVGIAWLRFAHETSLEVSLPTAP